MSDLKLIEEYKNQLLRYSPEQLWYIPEPGVWSICQMYNHLIEVAQEYLDNAAACMAASEAQPLGKTEAGERLYALGGFPPKKIKLPAALEHIPSHSETKEELAAGLDQLIQKMMEWEDKVDKVNPTHKIKHGGFGWLNAREWFDLIGMHFRHHLLQKSELEQKLGV